MKLLIYHDNNWEKDIKKYIQENDKNLMVLVSEHDVYKNISVIFPELRLYYYFIDIKRTNNEDEIFNLNKFIDTIETQISSSSSWVGQISSYSNIIYENFYIYLADTFSMIEKLMASADIEKIILVSGNPKVEYFSLILSEGERISRLLYKRSWMLNYYIYNVYKNDFVIDWINKDSYYKLKAYKKLKINSIICGKFLALLLRKLIKSFKKKKSPFPIFEKNKILLLMVRTPLQVEPLLPIYKKVKSLKNTFTPVFISMGSYLKPKVNKKLSDLKVEHEDLYDFISLQKLIQCFYNVFTNRKIMKRTIMDSQAMKYGDVTVYHNIETLIDEFSIFWIDKYLRHLAFDNLATSLDTEIIALINTEIENHNGSYDYYWTREKKIPLYTIQWVTYLTSLKPKMCWADRVYMMEYKDYENITDKSNFEYVGPIAYDSDFNTTKGTSTIRIISIFTQPDEYKADYFRIIDDVVNIVKGSNIRVIIKLHPREYSKKQFLNRYKNHNNIEIEKSGITSQSLIQQSDLSITITSGVIIQSLIIGTPCISINYDNKRPHNRAYLSNKAITIITEKEELEQIIKNFDDFYYSFRKRRLNYMKNDLKNYDGNSAEKFLNDILEQ